jgi:hypothetical protein
LVVISGKNDGVGDRVKFTDKGCEEAAIERLSKDALWERRSTCSRSGEEEEIESEQLYDLYLSVG